MKTLLNNILMCGILWTFAFSELRAANNIESIAERFINEAPVLIHIGKRDTLRFVKEGGVFVARRGDFEATVKVEQLTSVAGKRWIISFRNKGNQPIDSINIIPLYQIVGINDKMVDQPTVRWFSGSIWRDAQYPPIAFVEHEKRFLTNNNCASWGEGGIGTFEPVLEISSLSSREYIPALQFSLRSGEKKVGCTVLFEWSSTWKASATWMHITDDSPPSASDFLLKASYGLTNISLEPYESLEVPPVHVLYSCGADWNVFTNDIHKYILTEIAPSLKGAPSALPVSYDHWFGIGEKIDEELLKREADKAAEIGCEYFCVDAGWSVPIWGSAVIDSTKFPRGLGGLADYVRSKGMRFGLWNSLESGRTDFWKPDIQQFHTEKMEEWVKDLGVEWIRLEGGGYPSGKNALMAHKAMHEEIYGKFIRNHPGFYIEGCQGGGTRLDLNMIRTTHGTWISDHTGAPDVTRYYQTGALRIFPARFLNMAVETFKPTADSSANGHYILSRMAAVLSFDGDIAQWSDEATKRARKYVDIYKETREYKEQPVFFPFPQPRNDSDWDAVVYGDGTGKAQLLFVYRMEGEEEQFIKIPDAPGKWELLIDNGGARIKKEKSGYRIALNRNSSALWIRKVKR
ncbi:MAG: alpha-galactosidase [Prevotellaceae bacterium]|jgi:hypothetical protein|nr:alpha-galactosidase [Prevotellaceae bacterium]